MMIRMVQAFVNRIEPHMWHHNILVLAIISVVQSSAIVFVFANLSTIWAKVEMEVHLDHMAPLIVFVFANMNTIQSWDLPNVKGFGAPGAQDCPWFGGEMMREGPL
jgi:hypothetical protein